MLMVPRRPLLTCTVIHRFCTGFWTLPGADIESGPSSLEVAQVLEVEESRGCGPHGLADKGRIYYQGSTTVIGAGTVADMQSWGTKNLILGVGRAMKFEKVGRETELT